MLRGLLDFGGRQLDLLAVQFGPKADVLLADFDVIVAERFLEEGVFNLGGIVSVTSASNRFGKLRVLSQPHLNTVASDVQHPGELSVRETSFRHNPLDHFNAGLVGGIKLVLVSFLSTLRSHKKSIAPV